MNRRNFLQSSCQLCLLGAMAVTTSSIIEGCVAPSSIYKTNINNNEVSVPLSLLEGKKIQLVRAPENDFDIAIKPENDGTYKAFLLACTHHENPLNIVGNGFLCPLHGSQFDLEGNVKKGPASLPLTQYKTTIINNNLIITINA